MTVIGITGYARTGKDTVARHLVEEHGFRQLSFAGPLKELALRLDPQVWLTSGSIPRQVSLQAAVGMSGWDWAKENTTARDYLVALGAGARDILGADVWIRAVENTIRTAPPDDLFVVSDVRYSNEADMIRDLRGEVWMVERPDTGPANSEEERSMERVWPNAWLRNDGSLEELRSMADYLLDRWYKSRGGTGLERFDVV